MSTSDSEIQVLFGKEQVAAKVAELACAISADYRGLNPVLVAVLNGSFIFVSDLVRHLTIPHSIDFVKISSYKSSTRHSGKCDFLLDLTEDIAGKNVLVVDDIVDTGLTMSFLLKRLAEKRPASLKVCTLLFKPARTEAAVKIDYAGFTVPDKFVVGYGLDFDEKYRNLPYIGSIRS